MKETQAESDIKVRVLRQILGLCALLLAAAAAQAGVLSLGGRWSDRLDVLTHFSPVILALGLVSAIGCGLLLRSRLRRAGLTMAVIAMAASGLLMAPAVIAGMARHEPATGPTLKVVQFNTWFMNEDPQASLAWIKQQNADIIFVEECNAAADPINRQLRLLYPNWSSADLPRHNDMLVLSRLPLVRRQSAQGPPTALAVYQWRGREIVAVGLHAYWPIPPGRQHRQLRRLADTLNGQPKTWMIVGGDFNATPWSFNLRRFDKAVGLERRTHGQPTWPARLRAVGGPAIVAPFPFLAIDQVYAGPGWRTVSVRRGPKLGSDHYPIVVELTPR